MAPVTSKKATEVRSPRQVQSATARPDQQPAKKPLDELAKSAPRKQLDLSVPPSYLTVAGASDLAQLAANRLPDLGEPPEAVQTSSRTVEHHRTVTLHGEQVNAASITTVDLSATRFDNDGPREGSVQLTHTNGGFTAELHGNHDRGYDAGVGGSVSYLHENGLNAALSVEHQPLYARTQARTTVGTESVKVSAVGEFDNAGNHVGTGGAVQVSSGENSAEVAVIAKTDGTTRIDAGLSTQTVELSGSVVLDKGQPVGEAWASLKVQPSKDTRVVVGVTHDFDEQATSGLVGVEHQINDNVRLDANASIGDDDKRVTVGVNVRF